jgi:hypothetical protein
MTDRAPWLEESICREVFGILQHIASRPLSKGHDGPVQQAKERLRDARDQLSGVRRQLLGDSHFAVLGTLIDQLDQIPPEVIARTLIGPLGNLLSRPRNGNGAYPCCFVAEPTALAVSRLVVAVGPTIGLGDEILAARALLERARRLPGVTLHVSTHHPELWTCQRGPVTAVLPPPGGAFTFIDALSAEERQATACLFVDFLRTDLSPSPYSGPPGIAWGGRWSMGARDCDLLDLRRGVRYRSHYADGLPDCRWLEARWMAGRIFPGRTVADDTADDPPRASSPRRRRVILQPLTAKPGLTFPPEFYHDVIARVADAVDDFDLQIVPNPTPKGQALIWELLDALTPVTPSVGVRTPAAVSLLDVFQRLSESDLLFGPDTFTAHMAALVGLPQVTISLPEHRAWRTIESPCLIVVADRPRQDLVAPCARSIVAFLTAPERAADPSIAARAREWRAAMDRIGRGVTAYLHDGCVDTAGAGESIARVRELFEEMEPLLHDLLGRDRQMPICEPLDLSRFDHPEDRVRALARWYHDVRLSATSAILEAS